MTDRQILRSLHAETGSWKKVGLILGVNFTLAWAVGTGRRQSSPSVVAAIESSTLKDLIK